MVRFRGQRQPAQPAPVTRDTHLPYQTVLRRADTHALDVDLRPPPQRAGTEAEMHVLWQCIIVVRHKPG
jgi:hypothetical protein